MPSVLVPLADGVEEMEAVIIIDVLRRAGWAVTAVGMEDATVAGSRGVKLEPDAVWAQVKPASFDILILPGGGPGTERLCAHKPLLATIVEFARARKWLGAICAGPLVLQAAGVLKGRRATCHPAVADKLTDPERSGELGVVDDRIVTSQGPGTAFDFALTFVRLIDGEQAADEIAHAMVWHR